MEWKEGLTQEEYEKAIQSAQDKIRTEYVKKVKELEDKLPTEKSEREIELENREKELQNREREYKLKDVLEQQKLPTGLSKFIHAEDIDVAGEEIATILNNHLLNTSHEPTKHSNKGDSITKDQLKNMSYTERAKLEQSNPELYKRLAN